MSENKTANGNGTEKVGSLDGFRKIGKKVGRSLVQVQMWNPDTKEMLSIVVEDYDYQYPDGPFLAPAVKSYGLPVLEHLRNAPIDNAALHDYNVYNDIVFVGAEVEVVKGRKVPIGTTGAVTRIRDVSDRFGRHVATYADIATDGGGHCSTSVANLAVRG